MDRSEIERILTEQIAQDGPIDEDAVRTVAARLTGAVQDEVSAAVKGFISTETTRKRSMQRGQALPARTDIPLPLQGDVDRCADCSMKALFIVREEYVQFWKGLCAPHAIATVRRVEARGGRIKVAMAPQIPEMDEALRALLSGTTEGGGEG
jgi:hypothetical protein